MGRDIAAQAALSRNYLFLTIASCAIATLGLIGNSVAVIIGAMIIAPLISPIQAFAFGALAGDPAVVRRSLVTAGAGALIAVLVSSALALVTGIATYGSEIAARTRPTLLDLAIAVAAGAVTGFAQVRPGIANTVAGTSIAVALMPPLCVVGISLAGGQWSWAQGAALLFGTNFLGIALACMIVYLVAGGIERHSRLGIVTTALCTAALLIPLSASSIEIVRESRIEAAIRRELLANTVTFRRVSLIAAHFDWYVNPVAVRLDVSSDRPVSPSQVHDLEQFVRRRTGRTVSMTINVSRYDTVTDAAASQATPQPATPNVPTQP